MKKSFRILVGCAILVLVIFLGDHLPKQIGLLPSSNVAQVSSILSQGDGLRGDYYNGKNFETFFTTRTDSTIDLNWGERRPVADDRMQKDNFSVRWTGYVEPKYSEEYTFYTQSDDGIRLWVNDNLIVDHWINNSFLQKAGKISLVAGQKYKIKIEYYENGYDAAARLSWSSPSQAKQVIPQSQLYTALPVVEEPWPINDDQPTPVEESPTPVEPTPKPATPEPTTPTSKFILGDSIKVSANTARIRDSANGLVVGEQKSGATGQIVGGPTAKGDTTWWNVNFTSGVDGWSAQELLTKTTSTPTPSPTLTLSASPTSITSGQSSTLTWSSTNSTSCTASGGWTGTKTTSGTQTVSPTSNTTYTLTCTGVGGSAVQTANISVTTIVVAPSTKFIIGDSVQTTSALNVRSTANGTLLGTQVLGSTGTVVGGPVYAGGYHWWNIDYTSGVDGWSAEDYLVKNVVVIPTPTTPIQTPELPRVYVDTTMPVQTGQTITVNAGGNLQTALNNAQPGDTIVLQAGATFTGQFILPTKNNPNNKWIVIKTSAENNLPPQGERVKPSHAQYMPKIVTNNVGPALTTTQGANYYRFIGIEVTDSGQSSPYGPALPGGGTGNMNYGLIILGQLGVDKQLSQLPHHIVFDRSYIHGQPTTHVKFGIAFDGMHMAAIDSYISDIHGVGQDTQAIRGLNGAGPFKIVNNHLEASGENVMFGGADPSIPNLVPSDVEIRNNYFYKPLTWKIGHPTYQGIPWLVKNLYETKNIQRSLFEGNVLENSWVHGQTGFGFVMKSSNQSGKCSWCVSQDHTIRNNILRNTDNGASIHGLDSYNGGGGIGQRRVLFEQNLFENVGLRSIQVTQGSATQNDIGIRNNTIWSIYPTSYPSAINLDGGGIVVNNLLVENNVFVPGTSANARAIIGSGTASGVPSLNRFTTNWAVRGNAFVAPPDLPANMVVNNIYTTRANGGFVNTSTNNYTLSASSPLKGTAVGGGDPGADISSVLNATRGAVSGIWK